MLLQGADIAAAVFPDDLPAAEIELALRAGTRLRHDPTVRLLREVSSLLGRR